MTEKVTVTELNRRVKELLTTTPYLRDIWIIGEISNFKVYTSGHAYFTLKDAGGAVSSVMFRGAISRINFKPSDTMKVEAYGHVDLYAERGSYQFIVESMRPAGVGDLYKEYERLRQKLTAEGLFDSSKKRSIPRYPRVIGVVTSPTGAVIHDILTTTKRLYPADILLAPAKVQGDGAAASIVHGIELLNSAGVDVIIVGRGGGSLEDLWAFNEEPVVRAIVASKVPVISSVGHETDTTLSDFAADRRAPTPTGAAEMAVRDKVEIKREIEELMVRASKALGIVVGKMRLDYMRVEGKVDVKSAVNMVQMHQLNLDRVFDDATKAVTDRLNLMHRRFDALPAPGAALVSQVEKSRHAAEMIFQRPEVAVRGIVSESRIRFNNMSQRTAPSVLGLDARRAAITAASARLDALNPYSVLERGYSFVAGPDGRAITSVDGIQVGSTVTIRMRDGRADAQIKSKERKS